MARDLRFHVQRPAGPSLRRPGLAPGPPALHRPPTRRGRRNGRGHDPDLQPGAARQLGRRPERAQAGAGHGRGPRLIEGAGWTLGSDGIYVKDGRSAGRRHPVPVRLGPAGQADGPHRQPGARLRDGLPEPPGSWDDLLAMLNTYPHDIPGTKTPFDLYISGWSGGVDPDDGLSLFATSNISDAKHPDNPATSAASPIPPSTRSSRPGWPRTTRRSEPGSTDRRRSCWPPTCRRSSSWARPPPTLSELPSRPSTGRWT